MPKPKLSPWQAHVQRWIACKECGLCEHRKQVVLARGKLPCEVLFIGEAPGASENSIGRPFCGPAGKMLDAMIERAIANTEVVDPKLAFTNVVACIPLGEDGTKTSDPPKESILACQPRLIELIQLAKPVHVVLVGKIAHTWGVQALAKSGLPNTTPMTTITHPAAIMRAEVYIQDLEIQKCIIALTDVFQSLVPF